MGHQHARRRCYRDNAVVVDDDDDWGNFVGDDDDDSITHLHTQKHYTELFPASSIVYLCAESPNVLPDKFGADGLFTSSDVYVIGGLVDHNHHRAHCYTVASEREHRTARLPIAEKGIKLNGRYVLTTMEAFCSLTPVLAGLKDWETSLREAIAPRKLLLAPAGNSTEETLATDEAKAEDEAPDEDVLK